MDVDLELSLLEFEIALTHLLEAKLGLAKAMGLVDEAEAIARIVDAKWVSFEEEEDD